jgi:FG-GAP repeat
MMSTRLEVVGMRRILVVSVLLLASIASPAGMAVAHGRVAGHDAAAPRLRADFNNDGAADLAVGAPTENVGAVEAAGAVNVLYGSVGGLTGVGSQLFTQDTPGVGSTAEQFDFFGETLASGDFNDDGFTDLAIGAPNETVGTAQGAGAVNVLFGSATGLTGTGSQLFTEGNTIGEGMISNPFDVFGAALAAGDFDADGADDLAIGVPGAFIGDDRGDGIVVVLDGSPGGLVSTGPFGQFFSQNSSGVGSSAEAGDSFGETLAVGDFNNSGTEDLAVGVPFEDVGAVVDAGAVNVLYGRPATGLTGSNSQIFTQDSPGVGSSAEEFDEFGLALAGGDFNADDADDLAVGVPGEAVGAVQVAGAVNVLYGSTNRLSGTGSQLFTQDTPGVGSTAEEFDRFGDALAVGDFNNSGTEDLAVGAPSEAVGALQGAGAVNVLYGRPATGLTGSNSQIFTQDSPGVGSTAEEVDQFGAALAGGDFNADDADDLAVGAPGESVGPVLVAGAVNALYGSIGRLSGTGSQLFTQDSPGIGSTAEEFDQFGAALDATSGQ